MIDSNSLLIITILTLGLFIVVGWYGLFGKEFLENRRNKKKREQEQQTKAALSPKLNATRSHVAPTAHSNTTVSNSSNNALTDTIILSHLMDDHHDHKSTPVCNLPPVKSSSSSSNTGYWGSSSDSGSGYSNMDSGSSSSFSDSGSSSCD